MAERERRILIKRGETIRLVMEGGPLVDISNPSADTPFSLKQRSPDSRETQRERLKAQYPNILFPYINARLTQHGYKLLGGGEETSSEMMGMETQNNLQEWLEKAKMAGISNQEIREETSDLLKQVKIGSPRMGKPNPLINGIGTEISEMVDKAWGTKRKASKQSSTAN